MTIPAAFLHEFYQSITNTPLEPLLDSIPNAIQQRFGRYRHGLLDHWLDMLERLPRLPVKDIEIHNTVKVGHPDTLTGSEQDQLQQQLKAFHPWRKGPYHLHGISIDTEWRSDWKWERIQANISPLTDRYVLDVGCGNGYHCWRMLGAGSKMVIGIDPSQLFWMQFQVIKHFMGAHPVYFLPLGIEYLPHNFAQFDTVFSMGVLYHRKSPFDHLQQLRSLLREGGELVLETLIVEGDAHTILVPEERYACMGNVWFIPSVLALEQWLRKAGFNKVTLIDCTTTSLAEQRSTEWMQFQSLPDFLDPLHPDKTLEGYPAPRRATFTAEK